MSSRAVVTGAAGFIGSRVAAALRTRGFGVRGIDLRSGPGIEAADLARPGPWQRRLAGADLVVHAAAIVGELGRPSAYERANVTTLARVLDAAEQGAAGRVVHLSSIVVHGRRFPDGVTEDGPVRPTGSHYTDTKIASEHLAVAAHAGGRVPVTVVRPGDVYGPGSEQWTLRPVRLLRRRLFVLPGAGAGILSPVYVDDLVEAVVTAGTNADAAGLILHATGGEAVSARDFFDHYARLLGVPLRSVPAPLARAVGWLGAAAVAVGLPAPFTHRTLEYITHPGTYAIDRIRDVTGWTPQVPLVEGMARTATWLRTEGLV